MPPCRILLTHHPASAAPTQAPDWTAAFADPIAQWEAWHLGEVCTVLTNAEAAARAGGWAVFFLCYEAAPAFDARMATHVPSTNQPLAWAAAFSAPAPPLLTSTIVHHGDWQPGVSPAEYSRQFATIKECLRLGEVYQVNYTMPFDCAFRGDALAWHQQLLQAQQPGFGAYLEIGETTILSASPELFFHWHPGGAIRTRPMKGTAPRGLFPASDDALADRLAASPKERAENIMIVDLLRNDLGRLAIPGSVRVEQLCRVERYPTVLQMVSDVAATLPQHTSLAEVMAALFPCGSITGAPKVAAMDYIHRIEPHPRGVYCGAIGLIRPGGETICSVPIRTITLHNGRARCSVGGGVTWDSVVTHEYDECRLKLQFTTPAHRTPGGYSLMESMLLEQGRLPYLERHLRRLGASANRLGFPFPDCDIRTALHTLAASHPIGRHKLRLLLDSDGAFHMETHRLPPISRQVLGLAIHPTPVDTEDLFLYHKTTHRPVYDAALAAHPRADDVILCNKRGELTETCHGNLILELDGRRLTPSVASGLLGGVYRQHLLDKGVIQEAVLTLEDLRQAGALWRSNAVRRLQRCMIKVN